MATVDREQILHVANLARLALTEEEVERFGTQLNDILVAAVGVPALVTPDMVKAGATVIDVGINRTEAGLIGDVDPGVAERAGHLTPVPGGVGPMTIACMLANTVKAARARRGLVSAPS